MNLDKAKSMLGEQIDGINALDQAQQEMGRAASLLHDTSAANVSIRLAQAWIAVAKHQHAQAYVMASRLTINGMNYYDIQRN